MRDLSREKDRTREAVSQIVSWCLVIALHQTYGIGKKRQENVAAQALKIQKKAAVMLAKCPARRSSAGCAAILPMQNCQMMHCCSVCRCAAHHETAGKRNCGWQAIRPRPLLG